MSSYEGTQALVQMAELWALHDGTLRSLALHAEPEGVVLDALCVPRPESPVAELRLRFVGVTRFDLEWSADFEFYFVPGYKAFLLESDRVYLSLDPYDDRATAPDPRDGGVIEARSLSIEMLLKR